MENLKAFTEYAKDKNALSLEDYLESEELSTFTYEEIEDLYAEELDESHEPVELAGMTIHASDMKTIDPVMFRCGVADKAGTEFEEFDGLYYDKEEFDQAKEEFDEIEERQERIEEILEANCVELVSYGLAPNPMGFCFELPEDSNDYDQDEIEELDGLLNELTSFEEEHMKQKYLR